MAISMSGTGLALIIILIISIVFAVAIKDGSDIDELIGGAVINFIISAIVFGGILTVQGWGDARAKQACIVQAGDISIPMTINDCYAYTGDKEDDVAFYNLLLLHRERALLVDKMKSEDNYMKKPSKKAMRFRDAVFTKAEELGLREIIVSIKHGNRSKWTCVGQLVGAPPAGFKELEKGTWQKELTVSGMEVVFTGIVDGK